MLFKKELTYISLAEEFAVWSKDPRILRFGQYICNKYLADGQTAPEIYYEKSPETAYWAIVKHLPIPERESR